MANKRQFLKKNIYLVIVTLIVLVTVICVVTFNAFSAEIDGDHIIIGGTAYLITDTNSLVDADLALLRWRASGSEESVRGTLDGNYLEGFEAVYNKVYDMLLSNATEVNEDGKSFYWTAINSQETVIVKIASGATTNISSTQRKILGGGRLIVVAEGSATMQVTHGSANFKLGDESNTGTLVIQGRNEDNEITLTAKANVVQKANVITVNNGSLYLQHCNLTNFTFDQSGDTYTFSVIKLPKGNLTRFLYMSDSSMTSITGKTGESSGIMCQVYADSGDETLAAASQLFINHSLFDNCKVLNELNKETRGGAVIRSYAADRCNLLVQNSTFSNNSAGHETSNGTGTGGGAIYWKSVKGKAILKNCTFTNNHSNTVGGAILNTGTMEIQKCRFEGNTALQNGGAIAVEPPYSTINYPSMTENNVHNSLKGNLKLDSDTKIINNRANESGGGIYFNAKSSWIATNQIKQYEMELIIDGAEISGNIAGINGGGVGIYLDYEDCSYKTGVTINAGSLISNNKAEKDGGAIWINSAPNCDCKENNGVTMKGGFLQGNQAQNGGAISIQTGKSTAQINFNINGGTITNNTASANGGAAYIQGGSVIMRDATITECKAEANGGTIYVAGGNATMTGGHMFANKATKNGGAVCVNGGSFAMSGGTIEGDSNPNNADAQFGGAVYVSDGDATMTGGTLLANKAEQNGGAICIEGGSFTISAGMIQGDNNPALADAQLGGAVYVSGGNAHVNGGTLSGCSANSGGAIYVNGGTVTMLGGEITGNKATAGNGGAIYVTGTTNLSVMVRSGEISGNGASGNGGAICVQGVTGSTNTITVQIGVNDLHYTADGTPKDCDHTGNIEGLGNCPIVKNNVCDSEGGAIYIAGTDTTNLNIYCITEEGNRGAGNVAGGAETSLSDFLKVDGGKVLISATNAEDGVYYGDSNINSSIHVTGGDLQLSGTLSNPAIFAPITVDVVAKGGSYTDQRKNDEGEGTKQYYVVKYFENFKVGYGDDVHATGQYKVNQMLITESHTVWGVIYSYTGYTIVGWNTKDDGTGTTFEVSSKIDYEDAKEYMEGITLELYAIWSKDYYWIQFEPNVDVFSGGMGNEDKRVSFDCAGQTLLPENGYVNLGYRFLGWSTDPNTNEVKYTNNQTIAALSQTFGDIITLYAVWIDCDHSNDEWYVYTGSGDSVTCTCLCSYFVTATLVAPKNAVYNGSPHPAKPTFTNNSNNEFNEAIAFVGWEIAYTYTPFEIDYTTDKVVTDAGYYTATLMYKGATAKLDFTIAKGTQNAPATPTFTTGMTDGQGYLLVDQTGTTETKINYVLEYTKKDANGQASQHTIDPDPTYTEGIRFNDFDSSWTLYYVVAWYSGNNNYEESAHVKSKQTYIYKGKINIVIIDESNMQTSIIEDTENDRVSLVSNILNNDWYISGDYNASASGTLKKDDYADIVMENVFLNYFERSVTPVDGKTQFAYVIKNAFDDGYSGTIEIRFTGVKQAPTVSASGTPNEVFGDVTDTVTEISLDSAFTAYFEIEYFVDDVYANPVLSFGTALPSGTTIILIDKSNGSYWYKTIEASTGTVAITEFLPMRGTGTLSGESKLLKYQFIVDFSDVATPLSAGAFSVSLSYTIKNDTYAPEISAEKSITLKSITNTVGVPRVNVNSATVSVNYAQGAEASKWSEKELSLVLIPENLLNLPDASILVEQTIGEKIKTTVCERNPDGMFIVAMDPDAEFIKITLQSQMFKAETEYEFSMQIYSAYAGSAPMNGTKIGPTQTLTLYPLVAAQNAVKIEVIDNQVIYTYDDTINAKIFASVGTGYKATVTLLRKNSDGKYESTGWSQEWKPDDETSNYQTILIENIGESFGEGMYCISVVVRDEKTGTAVMTVPYYLIIQK